MNVIPATFPLRTPRTRIHEERRTPMTQSIVRRLSVLLIAAAVSTSVLAGCTKRIDTSTEAKFYKSWTEVMRSLPESRQREFDDGMSMIWFYSDSDEETFAKLDGKTGPEILALVDEMKASMPKVRASSGMIGTIRLPISLSRIMSLRMRTKAMVVATAWVPDPLRPTS